MRLRVPVLACLGWVLAGQAAGADDVTLTFGAIPYRDPGVVQKAMAPLVQQLGQAVGRKAIVGVVKDYESLGGAIRSRSIDIGFFTAMAYVEAKEKQPALRYMATMLLDGEGAMTDQYFGVILARTGAGISSVEALKGRRFGFTEPDSTSGHKFPRAYLMDKGLVPEDDFSSVFYLRKHDKVLQALLAGSIDGGAVSETTLRLLSRDERALVSPIAKVGPIPSDAVAAGPHVPETLVAGIEAALLSLAADAPALKEAISSGFAFRGFVKRDDSFYQPVRLVRSRLAAAGKTKP